MRHNQMLHELHGSTASDRRLPRRAKISLATTASAPLRRHSRGPRSRASCASLVAQLLARAWRASPASPLAAAEDLAEIAVLLMKSGASALAWHALRKSPLRNCPAATQLHQAYRLHSLQAAIGERSLKQVIPVLRSFGA